MWVGSQVVNRAQGTAAKVAGLPLEQVQGSAIGGQFQAVRIAKQVDGPVKVVWTREVDIRHDNDPPDWMRKACRSPDVTGSPVPRSKRDGAVSFGLKSRASGPPAIASIKAESGAAKLQGDTASGADDPAQEAAILSKSPGPSPMALVNVYAAEQ